MAGQLIEGLDIEVDDGAEAAWSKEIARRVEELEAEKIKTLPWSEARARFLETLDSSGKWPESRGLAEKEMLQCAEGLH